jgi:hypothetical protein
VLGVPTRSDAAKALSGYANSILMQEMGDKLRRFKDVFSYIYPHNHVVEAYRDTGNLELIPDEVTDIRPRRWRYRLEMARGFGVLPLVPSTIPKSAEALLKPELVRDYYLANIASMRPVVEDARSLLDRDSSTTVTTVSNSLYEGLLDIVLVTEAVTDTVILPNANGVSFVHKRGAGKGWKYSFNPYKLAVTILDQFEIEVNSIFSREKTAIEKITGMMRAANAWDRSANIELLESALYIGSDKSPFFFETTKGNLVHDMRCQNEEMVKGSDVYLRFDEWCFVLRTRSEYGGEAQLMIPAVGLLEESGRFHCYNLSHRETIRFLLKKYMHQRGFFVLNGVRYEQATVGTGPKEAEGFHASGPSFQEFANLLGRPVEDSTGTIFAPEPWAEQEVSLVSAYRKGDATAAEALIQVYNCETSNGNPSQQKALEQLSYSLSNDRYEIPTN